MIRYGNQGFRFEGNIFGRQKRWEDNLNCFIKWKNTFKNTKIYHPL